MGRAEEGEGALGSAIIVAAIGGGDGRDMLFGVHKFKS